MVSFVDISPSSVHSRCLYDRGAFACIYTVRRRAGRSFEGDRRCDRRDAVQSLLGRACHSFPREYELKKLQQKLLRG